MQNTILIVDDSEDTRELFRSTLETEGFEVLDAKDGYQALAILNQRNDISLMLLDLAMPSMSGFQLLEEMQKQAIGLEVPIIVVSASSEAKDIRQLRTPPNVKVIDALKKPFFYPELIYKIKKVHGLMPRTTETPQRPPESRW